MSLRSMMPCFACSLALAWGAPPASADVIRTARSSQLNVDYILGAGADGVSGDFSESETGLDARPALTLSGSDFNNGDLLGTPFTAQVAYDIRQEFQVQEVGGVLVELRSVGSVFASSTVTGPALAAINIRNPGNTLEMDFTVSGPTAYILEGLAADTGADNTFGGVRLHRWVGTTLVPIHLLTDGAFSVSGVLDPGLYRVSGIASAQADTGETQSSSWDYTLRFATTAVPEPPAGAMLGIGALVAWGWGRRSTARGR